MLSFWESFFCFFLVRILVVGGFGNSGFGLVFFRGLGENIFGDFNFFFVFVWCWEIIFIVIFFKVFLENLGVFVK